MCCVDGGPDENGRLIGVVVAGHNEAIPVWIVIACCELIAKNATTIAESLKGNATVHVPHKMKLTVRDGMVDFREGVK